MVLLYFVDIFYRYHMQIINQIQGFYCILVHYFVIVVSSKEFVCLTYVKSFHNSSTKITALASFKSKESGTCKSGSPFSSAMIYTKPSFFCDNCRVFLLSESLDYQQTAVLQETVSKTRKVL